MRNLRLFSIIIIFIVAPALIAGASLPSSRKTDKFLKRIFPDSTEIVSREIDLKDQKHPFTGKVVILRTVTTPNGLYYAVNGEVWGKSDPVRFIIVLNSSAEIINIKVLRARGLYGMRIKNRSWLSRFKGHSEKESIVYGKTIDSVSGATVSAKALIEGVKSSIEIVLNFIKVKQNP